MRAWGLPEEFWVQERVQRSQQNRGKPCADIPGQLGCQVISRGAADAKRPKLHLQPIVNEGHQGAHRSDLRKQELRIIANITEECELYLHNILHFAAAPPRESTVICITFSRFSTIPPTEGSANNEESPLLRLVLLLRNSALHGWAQTGFQGLDLRLRQLNAHKMYHARWGCFMLIEIKSRHCFKYWKTQQRTFFKFSLCHSLWIPGLHEPSIYPLRRKPAFLPMVIKLTCLHKPIWTSNIQDTQCSSLIITGSESLRFCSAWKFQTVAVKTLYISLWKRDWSLVSATQVNI